MFLAPHSLIALSTTKFINNPFLLFIINFFLHYVFDAIPHEKKLEIKIGFKNNKTNLYLFILNITIITLISFLFYKKYNANLINIIFALFGTIIPDVLGGLYRVLNIRFFKWASDLNYFAHKIILIKQRSALFYLFQLVPLIIFILIFL